jgi:AbrB family looped-hinge helix DNA binding protein
MLAIGEYLRHKPCLRGQILDRTELKRVAQACGLSPQQARLDANGRVLLPLGIRFKLDLNAGDKLAIDQLGDGTIIIKKPAMR